MRHCLVAAGSNALRRAAMRPRGDGARLIRSDPALYRLAHKPQITQSPLKRVGALDVLVPQERWHGLRLPEVVLLLDV